MVDQLKKTLELTQKDQLFNKLEAAGYAFAVWRMPNEKESQLIISLRPIDQQYDFEFGKLGAGFLINTFNNNHPILPSFIAADIIVQGSDVSLNPTVTSSEIDSFVKAMEQSKVHKAEDRSEVPATKEYDFEEAVNIAVDNIKAGKFEKVVLSRYKDVELPRNFSPWMFYQRVAEQYVNAFVSLVYVPKNGLWIGATPELLLSDSNNQFRTVALAGTKSLDEHQNLSEIAWTQKEIEEQALVSRYIINCFKKIRLREFHEHGPKTIQAGNLVHLKTEFIVDYADLSFDNLADQMLELLHPTSAVCGMPIEDSKPWIGEVEKYNREFYSGFLGPVNFQNSTSLYVNLRCMKIADNIARFFAGAGITEDSVAHKEFLETEMKMNVLMSMLK